MALPAFGKSVANCDFGQGKMDGACCGKLMGTVARDNKDTLTPDNKQERFVGGKGTPSGPLGLKGRGF